MKMKTRQVIPQKHFLFIHKINGEEHKDDEDDELAVQI